jgi:hypothetical protein
MSKRRRRIFPIVARAEVDLPGLASAGAYIWYDPRVEASVRVVTFPYANHGRILGYIENGLLTPVEGVILPSVPDLEVDDEPVEPPGLTPGSLLRPASRQVLPFRRAGESA